MSETPSLGSRERETIGRTVFVPVWVSLGLVALSFVSGIATVLPPWARYVPFLASVFVLGLPHGAVDHLATARVGGPVERPLAAVSVLYLVAGGTYIFVWLLAPAAGFVFFIALTWFHWGQGDLYVLRVLPERTHLDTLGSRVLCVVVRGGLPMVIPLLSFPEVYREVARAVVGLFDAGAIVALDLFFSLPVRLAFGGMLAGLSAVALATGYRRAGEARTRRSWRVDAIETCLLWGVFLAVPPILAIGLYFCLWHSLRHVVRVIALDDEGNKGASATTGSMTPGFVRFAREAAPLTAGALVIFAGLYLVAPVGDVPGLIALYLVLLAVLTLPHVLVVAWMDYRQGIW